ncbi:hypothetical protein GPECTOR_16g719 [Gonium pectorale]|uniref:Uncharacterized protein n=1 Tax=Gonium pectorale TaxID=33097 RepID=A0A150GL72_GONPE|nr:hypothetical protein GPECTOR_16g719 [Gonium pectorale]|eukprot:KXZ50544.1 hypothetical protein GPECTOR_16g719 [Gonium pectorale]
MAVPPSRGHQADCTAKISEFSASSWDEGAGQQRGEERASRVFKAVNDVYEYDGWLRTWIAVIWFIMAYCVMYYSYPNESGAIHSDIKALMTSYVPAPGANNADVRTVLTFVDGLTHALGFLTAYINKAAADGRPEESVQITEYDKLIFARLELDFASNCEPALRKLGMACYREPREPVDPPSTGLNGFRQLQSHELPFMSTYAYRAVLRLGVANSLKPYYRTAYTYDIQRRDGSTDIGALREIIVSIDNVHVRSLPLYMVAEDYTRAFFEVACLLLLLMATWNAFVKFSVCRAGMELHVPHAELCDSRAARRRLLHLTWIFFAQPWNAVDAISLLNYFAWWIAYM